MIDILEKTRHIIFDRALAQNVWYAVLTIPACIFILIWAKKNNEEDKYGPLGVWYPLIISLVFFSPIVGICGQIKGFELYFRRAWTVIPVPFVLAFAGVILVRMAKDRSKHIVTVLVIFVLVFAGHLIYVPYTAPWDDQRGFHRDYIWEPARDTRKIPADICDVAEMIQKDRKAHGRTDEIFRIEAHKNIRKCIRKIIPQVLSIKEDKVFQSENLDVDYITKRTDKAKLSYIVCYSNEDVRQKMKEAGFRYLGTTESGLYDVFAKDKYICYY